MILGKLKEILAEFPNDLEVQVRANNDGDDSIEDGDYLVIHDDRSVTIEYQMVVIIADKEYDEE